MSGWWWGWPPVVAWTRWKALLWWPCSSASQGRPVPGQTCGTGPRSHACHNACLCWAKRGYPWACPVSPPCKSCTISAAPSGVAPHCRWYNVPADRETRSCPCISRASTAWHSSVDQEPTQGPLPGCSRYAVRSRRPHRVAGDHTARSGHPLIRKERTIFLPGRQTFRRSWDTWHSWTHWLAGNCWCPRRPTLGCRGTNSMSPSLECSPSRPCCPGACHSGHQSTCHTLAKALTPVMVESMWLAAISASSRSSKSHVQSPCLGERRGC